MTPRHSPTEQRERAMKEPAFAELLVDPETGLAPALGWDTMFVGPLMTRQGWRTPTRGSLGKGWPDLVLVRKRDRRLIFAELKRETEDLRPEQLDVMTTLGALAGDFYIGTHTGVRIDVAVWRPSDLRDPLETSTIYQVLR